MFHIGCGRVLRSCLKALKITHTFIYLSKGICDVSAQGFPAAVRPQAEGGKERAKERERR